MKRILIADSSKASLVMTSEVFKDHFPGVQVVVAKSSSECVELAKTHADLDAIIIDFDLPDRDGAVTAARIKKFSPTPVLITAFDKPEVQAVIEKELAPHDDCLSWLKKPVRAELVVAVAQRFCEGKYRTQRRIQCAIPGILEIVVKNQMAEDNVLAAATKKPTSTTKPTTKPTPKKPTTTTPINTKTYVPVLIEDCSVGGVRIKLDKKNLAAGSKTKSLPVAFSSGDAMQVIMPVLEEIQTGDPTVTGNWLKSKLDSLNKSFSAADKKKSGTMSALQSKTKKTLKVDEPTAAPSQTLKGKVAWQADHGLSMVVGLQADNANQVKKLFETTLEVDARERNAKRAMTPTSPAASGSKQKLNA